MKTSKREGTSSSEENYPKVPKLSVKVQSVEHKMEDKEKKLSTLSKGTTSKRSMAQQKRRQAEKICKQEKGKESATVYEMNMNWSSVLEIFADSTDLLNVGRKYTCKARVVRVFDEWWSYLSCPTTTCKRSVQEKEIGNSYYCDTCKMVIPNPLPRYKARMEVEDYSGSAIVTVFNEDAETIIKHTCGELCEIAEMPDGMEKIENIFEKVVGTESIFQIRLSEYDMQSGKSVLTSSKVFPVVHTAGPTNFIAGNEKELPCLENSSTADDVKRKDETGELRHGKRICLPMNPKV